tara:strand:+ start:2207 stop:2491 length:285 start_codon:yes stop_codon:yes gene_type:complete
MIKKLVHQSRKKGIAQHSVIHWIHRIYGSLTIWRPRLDGIMGISLPCVLCRKALEKYHIRWRAYDGIKWIDSQQMDNLPKSKPTGRQKKVYNFN